MDGSSNVQIMFASLGIFLLSKIVLAGYHQVLITLECFLTLSCSTICFDSLSFVVMKHDRRLGPSLMFSLVNIADLILDSRFNRISSTDNKRENHLESKS